MSGKTSTLAILVHAALFAFLLSYIDYIPVLNQLDGFQSSQLYVGVGTSCSRLTPCRNTLLKCLTGAGASPTGSQGGTCKVQNGAGGTCDNSNYVCNSGLQCINGKCGTPPAPPPVILNGVGGRCGTTNNACKAGLLCENNICKEIIQGNNNTQCKPTYATTDVSRVICRRGLTCRASRASSTGFACMG
jgi:hypothetical protein